LRNIEIAQKLEAVADMLALQSANPFRVRLPERGPHAAA
jgi:hypothetical protein